MSLMQCFFHILEKENFIFNYISSLFIQLMGVII